MTQQQIPSLPETDLVVACREGQEEAFKQVIAMHQHQIQTTVVAMLGETAEATDIAQETFIKFFESVQDFRGEAKIGTYLTRIAINLCLNELKRRQRKSRWLTFFKKDDRVLNIAASNTIHEDLADRELVQKALQLLPPDFRVVIILRLLDGYTVKEVAEILQLPMGTIASRLSRGQKKLKYLLEKLL